MNYKQKFNNFLESLPPNDLSETIKTGFNKIFESDESLEHAIDEYYYDSKAGKYYDKSRDMYADSTDVQNRMDNAQKSNRVNNNMLSLLLKNDLINGNEYTKLHSRTQWPEAIMTRVHNDAKSKGITMTELWNKAKSEA